MIVAIGIDRYEHRRWSALRNAVSDAVGAAQAFQQLGFEEVVPPLLDERATGGAIEQLVTDELDRRLSPEDSLVVFYAGHGGVRSQTLGMHEVNTGYLIPVDAGDAYASWIELKPWLEQIARLPPRHILVILDACKSGIALSDALARTRDSDTAIARPFAAASRRRSRLLITSADEGELALDSGPRLGHSLFTGCLIDALIGGEAQPFVHEGRPMTIGSNLGHQVRNLVQSYPGEHGKRQTPVIGRFRHDEHGEMLIPALGGETTGSRPLFAQGSNELPISTSEVTAGGDSSDAAAPPVVDERPRRVARRIAMVAVLVALVGAVLGAAAWRLRSDDPPRARGDSPARDELVDPQVSVLVPTDGGDGDDGVDAAKGAGSSAEGVDPAGRAGTGDAAGRAQTRPRGPGGAPARPSVGGPARPAVRIPPRQAVATAPAGASQRQVHPVARPASGQPALCPFHYDGPEGATVEWNHTVLPFPADLLLPCGRQVELLVSQEHRVLSRRKMTATLAHASDRVHYLKKITVKVAATSKPSHATISQGKRVLGITPTTVDLAEAELVVLTISKPGFASRDIRVTPGADDKLFVELAPRAP